MGRLTLVALAVWRCCGADLSGTILDEKGKPAENAIVTVHRTSDDGPLRASEGYFRTTDKNGVFVVRGLAPGPFVVCAVVPGRDLIDSCQWGTPPIVRVAQATAPVSTTVQLRQGGTVVIRFDDPDRMLAAGGVLVPALAVASVRNSRGHFRNAAAARADDLGRNDAIVIPADTDVLLAISGANLTIADSNGRAADASGVPVRVAAGQTLQLRYVVRRRLSP